MTFESNTSKACGYCVKNTRVNLGIKVLFTFQIGDYFLAFIVEILQNLQSGLNKMSLRYQTLLFPFLILFTKSVALTVSRPNIILIITDDQVKVIVFCLFDTNHFLDTGC